MRFIAFIDYETAQWKNTLRNYSNILVTPVYGLSQSGILGTLCIITPPPPTFARPIFQFSYVLNILE